MPINNSQPFGLSPVGSTNLPNFGANPVNPNSLNGSGQAGANPSAAGSIYDLLSNAPQSLTSALVPYIQSLFQNQSNAGVAMAQSNAQQRGLTGSSIESAGMEQAASQANTGLIQSLIPLLTQTGTFDINNTQGYYGNLAGAVGQNNAQQIQLSEFQNQLYAMQQGAGEAARAQEQAGLYSMLGQLGGGAAMGAGYAFSDIRVKEDIKPLGTHKGHKWYAFKYRQDTPFRLPKGPQVGVMGHEVVKTRPDCVSLKEGHFLVDYRRLLTTSKA